jgi:hypothetical protein
LRQLELLLLIFDETQQRLDRFFGVTRRDFLPLRQPFFSN